MRTAWPLMLVLLACSGDDTDETDTGFPPDVCRFETAADRFTFEGDIRAGTTVEAPFRMEMRCPEPTGLTLAWEDGPPDAFDIAGPMERTLDPYEPTNLILQFTPPSAGRHEARLVLTPDDVRAGGRILRLEGTATE
jgi:hypothetical protein